MLNAEFLEPFFQAKVRFFIQNLVRTQDPDCILNVYTGIDQTDVQTD